MDRLSAFFAGALLCNCIPHLAAGLQGRAFPTPFAKPPGIGRSSPGVNVVWGAANLFFGLYLLPLLADWPSRAALAAGFLLLGLWLARHFGKLAATQP